MKNRSRCSSRSCSVSCGTASGATETLSSAWNSKQVSPPKAAMYWSCLPTGSPKQVDLDVRGLLGQGVRGHVLALEGVDRAQQADGERPRRAEPGARRDVGQRHHLDARLDGVAAKDLADDRVLDLVDRASALEPGVLEQVVVGERAVEPDEHVLVDRRRDHEARAPAVERGQIGAPAADRDPKRCAGYEHEGGRARRPVRRAMLAHRARALLVGHVPLLWVEDPPAKDEEERHRDERDGDQVRDLVVRGRRSRAGAP